MNNRLLLFLALLLTATLACSQTGRPVVYVTATVATAIPSGEPTLPNPFKPTPTPSGPTPTAIQPTPNATYPPQSLTTNYTVQEGDTLAGIAEAYSVNMEQVLGLNPGLNTDATIFVGQVLVMPGRPDRTTPNIKLIPDSELVNSPAASKFDIFA